MKRDMNLIRDILLRLESNDKAASRINFSKLSEPFCNVVPDIFKAHIDLAKSHGLIDIIDDSDLPLDTAWICLTWEGYDFLDAIRSSADHSPANIGETAQPNLE